MWTVTSSATNRARAGEWTMFATPNYRQRWAASNSLGLGQARATQLRPRALQRLHMQANYDPRFLGLAGRSCDGHEAAVAQEAPLGPNGSFEKTWGDCRERRSCFVLGEPSRWPHNRKDP